MRILLYSGKGGVGKTSIAAATGLRLSHLGHRTLVMSVDPAHSLGDSFDLGGDLFHGRTADPLEVAPNLHVQEVNIQTEVRRHWRDISSYITGVLRTTGIDDVQAEELAILPGMEELSALMYVNQYRLSNLYDVVILDCAPTAESIRFISMPSTLEWYMKHIFPVQRNILKAVRPLANRLSPVELPSDKYFGNILDLFSRLEGIQEVLEDPTITSARLVTNPEHMVLRETQRAFVYFGLHGLTVDTVIANRVLPEAVHDTFFTKWRAAQQEVLSQMKSYFDPVPLKQVPLFTQEVMGVARLTELANMLYTPGEDPSTALRTERPYTFHKAGEDKYEIRLQIPFAEKGEVHLFKKNDELVVEIGSLRRHIGLPSTMTTLVPRRARLDNRILTVELTA
ncbi:MAG: TRC40/GET3/ArsA family transport-energizing ATPase [Bryobacteraceae bacterium]|nr:TRC40/GET3/ArsA family transport-energizing ATPase [Bryobacteraceae bacterium]